LKLKIIENCTQNKEKLQDLRGKREIKDQVVQELSKIPGLKLLSCKLHGVVHRKKLVSVDKNFYDYPLLRIQVKYMRGKQIHVETPIVYPSDVYPYGRKTLDVVEEIAFLRYRDGYSWHTLGNVFYDKYDFSLNSIKSTIDRLDLVFNRLLTVRIIAGFLTVSRWLCAEEKSFRTLSLAYRNRLLFGLFSSGGLTIDLFSP
jgi:hypothetical protein